MDGILTYWTDVVTHRPSAVNNVQHALARKLPALLEERQVPLNLLQQYDKGFSCVSAISPRIHHNAMWELLTKISLLFQAARNAQCRKCDLHENTHVAMCVFLLGTAKVRVHTLCVLCTL